MVWDRLTAFITGEGYVLFMSKALAVLRILSLSLSPLHSPTHTLFLAHGRTLTHSHCLSQWRTFLLLNSLPLYYSLSIFLFLCLSLSLSLSLFASLSLFGPLQYFCRPPFSFSPFIFCFFHAFLILTFLSVFLCLPLSISLSFFHYPSRLKRILDCTLNERWVNAFVV